jgi:hypothetical protein
MDALTQFFVDAGYEIVNTKQKKERPVSMRNNYKAVAQWVMNNRTGDSDLELITVNGLRNILFDLAPIMSGYCSKAAIEEHDGRLSKMTVEHYHSRTRMARAIVDLAKQTNNVSKIQELVMEACKAHRTTKRENLDLVEYQKQDDYNWEEAYASVGIELVEYDGPRMDIKYDGVVYNVKTKAELMRKLGISEWQLKRYGEVL